MPLLASGGGGFSHPSSASMTSSRDVPQYESVQVRHRGAWDFASYYESLCVLQDSCPLAAVKTNLSLNILDVNADRVREEDWEPIISSIKINKSLETIAFRSYYDPEPEDIPTPKYPILKSTRKEPVIRKKEILHKLCCAIRDCLRVSSSLKVLELQGLPLAYRDIEQLSSGLQHNSTLTKLSLAFCDIGNEATDVLCLGMKQTLSVWLLDLTCCDISPAGAASLAKLVVYQSSLRHAEAWQDSLRYRRPNLDMLIGLRRIILNGNAMLSDDGAACFADALRDDLWLKALDLQKCGLTNDGAKSLLEVLKFSVTMVVCDIRKNPFVDKELVRSVTEQCLINCQGRDAEYPWLKMKSSENPDIIKLRSKAAASTTPTPRSSSGTVPSSRRPKKSRGSAKMKNTEKKIDVPVGSGYPWRTALRVNRHKAFYSESGNDDMSQSYRGPESENLVGHTVNVGSRSARFAFEKHAGLENMDNYGNHFADIADDDDYENAFSRGAPRPYTAHNAVSSMPREAEKTSVFSSDMRVVMVELEKMKMKLERETDARRRCDQRLIDLEIENSRLRREVLSARNGASSGAMSHEQSIILDSVEETFKKFSKFLDLLRQAGFGDLADLAGLDASDLERISNTKQNQKGKNDEIGNRDSISAIVPNHASQFISTNNSLDNRRPGGSGDALLNKYKTATPDSVNHESFESVNSRFEYQPKSSEELMNEIKTITQVDKNPVSGTHGEPADISAQNGNTFRINKDTKPVATLQQSLTCSKDRSETEGSSENRLDSRGDLNIEDILNENSNIHHSIDLDDVTPSPMPLSIISDYHGATD